MTIIVGVKFSKGIVVATDSRETYGESDYIRDQARKVDTLIKKFAVTSCGLTGATDRILLQVKERVEKSAGLTFDELVKTCEDVMWDFYKKFKERLEKSGEEEGWNLQLFSLDRMVDIQENGFSEEESSYLCEGSGTPYAEYILRQRYKYNLTEDECKALVAYVVLQTSRIDPNVGGDINIATITKDGVNHLSRQNVDEIVENISETAEEYEFTVQSLVKEIVEDRRWVNDLFQNKFKTTLFSQNEIAISEIQRTCKNESDFTSRISALAVLIDGMRINEIDENGEKVQGSINQLEQFAEKNLANISPECIINLRDIHTLRSKKMPIHLDDPKIIQILLKWEYKIPPNWSNLWIEALKRYRDALQMLKSTLI
jgi:20S proteasome alpha/beta subunit